MAGKPRKLRDAADTNTGTVTIDGAPRIETVTATPTGAAVSLAVQSKFLPYSGSNNLAPNEPRFFVNGRKLLRVIKTQHGSGKDGKPAYIVSRSLFRTIFDNTKKGKVLRSQLKSMGIPGA